MEDTYWVRMAARVRPTKALEAIEQPMSLVRLSTGAAWGATVFAIIFAFVLLSFDEQAAAWTTLGLAIAYIASWAWFASTGGMLGIIVIALGASVVTQIASHILLGGYANSGAFLMWGITNTFMMALTIGRRGAIAMGAFYVVVAVVAGLFEETLRSSRTAPDLTLTTLLFVLVMIGNLVMVAAILLYFLGRLEFERERAEGLLLNVLPAEVASELKEKGRTTAQQFDSVSVLFADIVGFTPMSAAMEPEEMVGQLNDVFTYFDELAERHGCEKIRTIGDNYMVASGLPTPRDDHAQTLCAMALDMLEYSKTGPLSFRLGSNSGPVVAGVIGTKKFQYDMWGDTVNTASRMESHGEADRIQISEATYELIKDDFATTPRGPIEVKGKGTLNTYWLEASREPAVPG